MGSYIPAAPAEQREMLEAIGLRDFRELYRDVPESMYLDRPLDIPAGMSELEAVSYTHLPQRHVHTTKGQERRKLCTGAAGCGFVPDAASVVSALQGLLYRLPSGRPDFFKVHLTIPFPLW